MQRAFFPAVLNAMGFLFLAYASFTDADIHIKDGLVTLGLGALTLALCLLGIRTLVRPRVRSVS